MLFCKYKHAMLCGIGERRLITVKKQFGIALVTALLMLLTFALCASAAGTATVVYLSGSGNNEADGLTPETAVAGLNAAYNLLDPDKDCTVVLCGAFSQSTHFARAHSAKSITITSVYGGVDYRDSGAVYKTSKYARFGLADDTTFENVTFASADGTSFMVVGQHHAVTIGEGVAMNNYTGGDIGKAFWVVGSVQHNFGGAAGPKYVDRPTATHVTVLSGSDMIVVGGPRQFGTAQGVTASNACTYGDINVHIGGTAAVNELYAAGYQSRNTTVGSVRVEVFGDASVGAVYGAGVHNVAASDLTLLWTGGEVGSFAMKPNGSVGLTAAGAVTLEATDEAQASDSYTAIAMGGDFTDFTTHTHDFDYTNGKVLTPATCQAEGKVLYPCKTCSATEEGVLGKTEHNYGDWMVETPADFGVKGVEKRTCTVCNVSETRDIPAITAKLELGSVSAATDKTGAGTIRLIAKLVTTADATVTRYGIFVAKTDVIGSAKVAEWTATDGTETAFALDLAEIPQSELDTTIYAWAFVEADGVQYTLPIAAGVSVNTIIEQMGA